MTDDEKRSPEVSPETEGAAPASASALGTATTQNKALSSNYSTSWRRLDQKQLLERLLAPVRLTSMPLAIAAPSKEDLAHAHAVGLCEDPVFTAQVFLDAPDAAYPRIAEAVVDLVGDPTKVKRREVVRLFEFAVHGYASGWKFRQDKNEDGNWEYWWDVGDVALGYVGEVDKTEFVVQAKLCRAPASAYAYLYALFDAAYYAAVGMPQVSSSVGIAEYQPDCNETDAAPYALLTNKQLERQFRRWGKHLGGKRFKEYLACLEELLPEVDFTEELSPMECPIANGMLSREDGVLTVRPYTPEDYRLGKYSGIRFRVGADGVVVPPDEPRIARSGRPDWTPGEWFRDAMPDEDGRKALLAVLILLMFPAVNIEKAIVFYGLGRNGKGTFLAMMRAMVGAREFQQRYLASVGIEKLASEYYLARLVGKLANLVDETDAAYLKHMASAKAAIGGDVVTGRDPYGKAKEFVAKMLFVYCLNTELTTAEQTEAIFNRFAFITFPSSFFDRPGGIDRRIKEDFMQRPEVCSWFAYLALTQVPYFETSAIIDDNAYVVASNAENLAEANPTIRAWRLLREEVETSGEDGPAKWAGVCAMPVCVAHALMSAAKERYEGDAGKLPRQNGRTFRGNLERAAKADGFRIVRNDDGTAKQLPMREWWDEGAMAPLVDALGDEGLKGWLKDHADARPRAWLVRDYDGPDSSPAARAADEAEADGVESGIARGVHAHASAPHEPEGTLHDAKLRREYGEFKGKTVAASLAPNGYEVWLAPGRIQISPVRPDNSWAWSFCMGGKMTYSRPAPTLKRSIPEGATSPEATRVLLAALDVALHHHARVCVAVPRGVVVRPEFGAWLKLSKVLHESWEVRPVTRRALQPAGGTS